MLLAIVYVTGPFPSGLRKCKFFCNKDVIKAISNSKQTYQQCKLHSSALDFSKT